MARVRTIESINAEIVKIQEELDNLQQKYDKTAAKLEALQEQNKSIRPSW